MNNHFIFVPFLCLSLLLCQCSSGGKKKVDPADQSLAKRTTSGPDLNKRSRYEKYMNDPKMGKSSAGSYFQKQAHHSKTFNGADSYSGQKEFKTSQSIYGKSKAPGMNMTYSLGDKQASEMKSTFRTDASRFGSQQAKEASSVFSGADNQFNTGSALTRSQSIGKAPKIIENYNDKGGKKSAYSEEEVRRLLNRN